MRHTVWHSRYEPQRALAAVHPRVRSLTHLLCAPPSSRRRTAAMNPSRPLHQAAAAAATAASTSAASAARATTPATTPRPRRRVRPPPPSSTSTTTTTSSLVPPSRDLIGPPCPLSNLRPVYYAPLFPSLHAGASPSSSLGPPSSRPHPYSLAEFPTTSTTTSSSPSSASASAALPPGQRARLESLRRHLAEKDLAWRLTRYRLDAFNQAFWSRQNARFLRARDEFLARHGARAPDEEAGGEEVFPPGPSAALRDERGGASDVDLAQFYKAYLEETKGEYARYNTQLWRLQGAMLWPALKAVAREWRWRWECWRAGVRDV